MTGATGPFIVVARENNVPKSVEQPFPTITTMPAMAIVTPTLQPFTCANRAHAVPKGDDAPLPTFTSAGGGGVFLVEPTAEPFVLGQQSGSAARSMAQPLPTIATDGAIALVDPLLTPYHGKSEATSVDAPLGTQTTKARFGLCSPLVVPYGPQAEARDADSPLPTILTKDRLGICTPTVEPFLVPQFGERSDQAPRVHAIDAPVPAVTSHGAGALVQPVIVQAALTHQAGPGVRSTEAPLYTITTDSRLGLAEPTLEPAPSDVVDERVVLVNGVPHVLDIRFRMLTNRELARAMGFDDQEIEYEFTGTIQQVTRQIGNAVAVNLAAALVGAVLAEPGRPHVTPAPTKEGAA